MMRKKKRTEEGKEKNSGQTQKPISKDLVLQRKMMRTRRVAAASQGDKDTKPKQPAIPTSSSELHRNEKPSTCHNFKVKFTYKADHIETDKNHKTLQNFYCDYCGKKYKLEMSVVRHMKTCKRDMHDRQFECDYCHKSFTTKGILQVHIRIHTGYRPYKCTACRRSFIQVSGLNNHLLTHKGLKPHICKLCKERFRRVSKLKLHMRKMHSTEDRDNELNQFADRTSNNCDICNRNFKTFDKLQKHLTDHLTAKFSCDVCGKKFKYRRSVVRHMLTHSDERLFRCGRCYKSFKTKGILEMHERIHTGDRPYQCTVCARSFIQKTTLNNHLLTHTGLKPHICSLCKERFRQASHLKMHMRKLHSKDEGARKSESVKSLESKLKRSRRSVVVRQSIKLVFRKKKSNLNLID